MVGETLPQTGIRAIYHLSDTADSGPSGLTLTNNASVTFSQGKFNNGADFGTSGTTKSLYVANDMGIQGGAGSLSCWLKLNTEISGTTPARYFLVFVDDATTNTNLFIDYQYNGGTRRLNFERGRNGVADDQFLYNITLGTSAWYHLVVTYDGSTVRGYINGSFVGSVASTGNGSGGSSDVTVIGNNAATTGVLQTYGIIDEVSIWNTALSASYIKRYYTWALGRHATTI